MEGGKVLLKRTVEPQVKKGMTAWDMLLIGILLAAGVALKFFVGSFFNIGMKPNFFIAMYCLIIHLARPKLCEAAIIGILAGAVVMCLLTRISSVERIDRGAISAELRVFRLGSSDQAINSTKCDGSIGERWCSWPH